ncbi:class I SAM-dependent methyltransferase [Halobacillus yeomjeoni]|uniref:class I SAM-dependent methyltransferase n=1 Tax=Halobacillus yeomjeoni TaxID=311194 RepID=UPI001CD3135D|nr:class I SAM-dependent methyltransferase [Halobacillus yeomjeoni]MCA0982848.1 class I SAM-dependent methyltransferase [Halobacillus yeomjeoni]
MKKVIEHNSKIWDRKVEESVTYTRAVSSEVIEKSRRGDWQIGVTADKQVPRSWFPESVEGLKVLCLASGGGQQGPILAAAGAEVTVVDISVKQLEQDQAVAVRDNLKIHTVQAEMTNLPMFEDKSFDLIVHPVSNVFIEDVHPVWKECARVLKDQGVLISGFMNPALYLFDEQKEDKGILEVAYTLPYSSLDDEKADPDEALEFSHTLEDQLRGQMEAGFVLTGFYEDDFGGGRTIDRYMKSMMATRAVKFSV